MEGIQDGGLSASPPFPNPRCTIALIHSHYLLFAVNCLVPLSNGSRLREQTHDVANLFFHRNKLAGIRFLRIRFRHFDLLNFKLGKFSAQLP